MTDPASLQNLHPIVMPPDVGFLPLAPGWYAAALVVLLLIGRFAVWAVLRWRANWYRREGLQRLEALRTSFAGGDRAVLPELPVLLKAAALVAYPRQRVAGLHGEGWRSFLNETVKGDLFSAEQGALLENLSCGSPAMLQKISGEELAPLFLSVKNWLERHRAIAARQEDST